VSALESRASRVVWAWCLAYTAVALGEPRRRRRGEILSHLWESERAGITPSRVLRSALAGAASDLSWAAATAARTASRGVREPGVHLGLAALVTVQSAFLWGWTSARTTHLVQAGSTAAAGLLLVVGGVVYVRGRRIG
jgi:hypothetical protein